MVTEATIGYNPTISSAQVAMIRRTPPASLLAPRLREILATMTALNRRADILSRGSMPKGSSYPRITAGSACSLHRTVTPLNSLPESPRAVHGPVNEDGAETTESKSMTRKSVAPIRLCVMEVG
jgi:hypothetical protein